MFFSDRTLSVLYVGKSQLCLGNPRPLKCSSPSKRACILSQEQRKCRQKERKNNSRKNVKLMILAFQLLVFSLFASVIFYFVLSFSFNTVTKICMYYPCFVKVIFLKRFYLFIHEKHRERERERGRDRDTGRGRSRLHAGSPMWDWNPGLQDQSLVLNH